LSQAPKSTDFREEPPDTHLTKNLQGQHEQATDHEKDSATELPILLQQYNQTT
jgi:hypothetical protein